VAAYAYYSANAGDPADVQINPDIQIRIPDQILAFVESALSECSC